MAVMLKNN